MWRVPDGDLGGAPRRFEEDRDGRAVEEAGVGAAIAIAPRISLMGVTVKEPKVRASKLTSVLLWHSVVQFP